MWSCSLYSCMYVQNEDMHACILYIYPYRRAGARCQSCAECCDTIVVSARYFGYGSVYVYVCIYEGGYVCMYTFKHEIWVIC
jgi:hypothetical protein